VPAGATVTVWLGLSPRALTAVVHDSAAAPAAARHALAPRVVRVAVDGEYVVRVGLREEGAGAWTATTLTVGGGA